MSYANRQMRGFTLVEMAIVILVLGMLFAFSVPAFQRYNQSQQLKGTTQNVASELRLLRERAIANGEMIGVIHFNQFVAGTDWHYHDKNGNPVGLGKFPRGVTLYSDTWVMDPNPAFTREGRSSASGDIVLQDRQGARDTISVQLSGLILTQ